MLCKDSCSQTAIMGCRRRCMKFGIKQRLLLIVVVFLCAMIFLHRLSWNSEKTKNLTNLGIEENSEKFPHYPDILEEKNFNNMDREIALLEPYMNKQYVDKDQRNDFKPDRVHTGHSLLSESIMVQIKSTLLKMSTSMANSIPDIEDFIVDVAEMLQNSDIKSMLTCKAIDSIAIEQEVDVLEKKLVYKGMHHNWEVAVKAPWKDLTTKTRCLQKLNDFDRCTAQMNFQVLREIFLHSVLHHSTIVKMLGYCIRGDRINNYIGGNGVIAVTEIGASCPPQFLAVLLWRKRLAVVQTLAKFLIYLESSPLGTLRMVKVTGKDFVCVKDELKYTDLDELRLGELTCGTRKDCFYKGMDVGISCDSGLCKGLNAKSNLRKIYDVFFPSLLKNMPEELSSGVHSLMDACLGMKITPEVLLRMVQQLIKIKVKVSENEPDNRIDPVRPQQKYTEVSDSNLPKYTYVRVNSSNLPGSYDFTCSESRVSWGCAIDVKGMTDAMRRCNAYYQCKSFVAFTKFPEVSSFFTVVLKNGKDSFPVSQEGVTLFIKEAPAAGEKGEGKEGEVIDNKPDQGAIGELKVDQITDDAGQDRRQCTQNLFREQRKLRRSAEKRLMTHLGMKGLEEKSWLNEVKEGQISGSYPLISTDGQFMVTFDIDRMDGIDRAVVMTDTGDNKHYLAQAISFFIDRLFGLYHVPPTAVVQLPSKSLTTAWDEDWFIPYKSKIENGFLPAVMTVPKPKAITAQDIILPRPESYVTVVATLSKKQRIQMEYIILMWLTRMPHPSSGHVGYKGHLVHYESDKAFLNLSQSWILNYFYNCQFPKSVARLLNCFRCIEDGKKVNRICSLGKHVLNLVWPGNSSSVKLKVNKKSAQELETIINDSASRLLTVIDKCVRLFSKDTVLY